MIRPHRFGLISKILTIAGLCFLLSARTDSDSSEPGERGERREPGRPIRIDVHDGQATFDLPTPRTGSRTLVIVSALARKRGPYPIRLTSRPTQDLKPIERASPPLPARPNLVVNRPQPPPPAAPAGNPAEHRTFHLIAQGGDVSMASSYLAVDGRLRAVGKRIQVYVDVRDTESVEESTLLDLVSTFDERIFPEAARRFGSACDVDRDGRFTVLFSSWLSKLAGGTMAVDGFVRGADLDPELAPPFGNRCDMMYLNAGLKAGPHLRTIVAHEYTHAVTFSRKVLTPGSSGLEEEGWLDEALAHLVEDAHGFSLSNIDYRVSAFLSKPESYRLVVEDYYAAKLFRSHGNRGATYLFLRWCVDRYGPGLLDTLIRSDRRGVANLEAATGCSFAELFRNWTVALYLSGLDPSIDLEAGYRSIDARGKLDDWILAGPKAASVGPATSSHSWSAEGTSTHFVVIEGFPGARGVTVDIQGAREAGLQVTAVNLPDSLPSPELTIRPGHDPAGHLRFQAELTESDGSAVRLDALAWEPLVPAQNPREDCGRRGHLDRQGIEQAFGTSSLPARATLRAASLPLAGFRETDGLILFKMVGTDSLGRRVAAWSVVDFDGQSSAVSIEEIKLFR